MLNFVSWIKKQMRRLRKSKPEINQDTESCLEYRTRQFYVVFSETNHFFSPFLKPGFTHCYVIEELEYVYMVYDPTRYGLNMILPNCDKDHPFIQNLMDLDPTLKVLRVVTKGIEHAKRFGPRALNCVSMTEYAMGVSFGPLRALTPFGLYKKLKKGNHPSLLSVREITCHQEKAKQKEPLNEPQKQQQWTEHKECRLKSA
jgi:hypothetical protein